MIRCFKPTEVCIENKDHSIQKAFVFQSLKMKGDLFVICLIDCFFRHQNKITQLVMCVRSIHGVVVWWTETAVSGAEDSMETNEAAAALLNMESPNNILDEKRMSKPSLLF